MKNVTMSYSLSKTIELSDISSEISLEEQAMKVHQDLNDLLKLGAHLAEERSSLCESEVHAEHWKSIAQNFRNWMCDEFITVEG